MAHSQAELIADLVSDWHDPLTPIHVERQTGVFALWEADHSTGLARPEPTPVAMFDAMSIDPASGWHLRHMIGFNPEPGDPEAHEGPESWAKADAYCYLPPPIQWPAVDLLELADWLKEQLDAAGITDQCRHLRRG